MQEIEYLLGKNFTFIHHDNELEIKHPVYGDVEKFDVNKYFQFIRLFTTEPVDVMYQLWKQGIDYEKISEFDFFIDLYIDAIRNEDGKTFKINYYDEMFSYFFNFDEVRYGEDVKRNIRFLLIKYNGEEFVFDEELYNKSKHFFKKIHGIQTAEKPKWKSEGTKKMIMDLEADDEGYLRESKVTFASLVSYLLWNNTSGINHFNIKQMPMYAITDGLYRLGLIDSNKNLIMQITSGNFDSKKYSINQLIAEHDPRQTNFKEEI